MTDSEKLNALALWFDVQDRKTGNTDREVQQDLRLIATNLESLRSELEQAKDEINRHKLANSLLCDSESETKLANEVYRLNTELSEAKQRIAELERDDSLPYRAMVERIRQLENPERIKEILKQYTSWLRKHQVKNPLFTGHFEISKVKVDVWFQTPKGKKLLNLE